MIEKRGSSRAGVIQDGCGGVVSKKIEIVLLICATHNELPTIKMTTIIAICHNRVCADCGQPENECALEITEQDKLVCCDCLYPEEEEEDTCECCGKPYDDRSNHYLWEMCDCVQNDDGTLSRPEVCEECGVPETDECRPDCAYQARRQREEEEEHRQRTE